MKLIFLCCYYTDDESSVVHGILTKDGLFDGTISTKLEDYHIEPVNRYFHANKTNDIDSSSSFHTIIYKATDVRDPRKGLPCASHLLQQQNSIQNIYNSKNKPNKGRTKRWLLEAEAKLPFDDATNYLHPNRSRRPFTPIFDLNQPIDEELDVGNSNRTNIDISGLIFRNVNKRASIDPKKTTCMLYLQADHQFFQKYGTEEACIEVMTRHVQRVNAIYRNTGKYEYKMLLNRCTFVTYVLE